MNTARVDQNIAKVLGEKNVMVREPINDLEKQEALIDSRRIGEGWSKAKKLSWISKKNDCLPNY